MKPKEEMKKYGHIDCMQDACENAPFACIGGLQMRDNPQRPRWLAEDDFPAWLEGYIEEALKMYGPEWRTVKFGWSPAITILGTKEE